MSLVAQTREGWYESELHRLQGELLLQLGTEPRVAEQSFIRSLEVARKQEAVVLELHTAISLSQLWLEQGKTNDVTELLKPIIARFDEKSKYSKLNEARKLFVVVS